MSNWKGKVVLVSGGSRGIGLATAIRLAKEGAKIAITGKTADPHAKLPGTIYSAADDCKAAGATDTMAIPCDVRDEKQVNNAVEQVVKRWGGIDVLINNASAISVTPTEQLGSKMFDLMNAINSRGTWLVTKACIPHLKASAKAGRQPHILSMCPPIITDPEILGRGTAYLTAKMAMSMGVLGHSGELREAGVGVNGLWPRYAVYTAAIRMIAGESTAPYCLTPDVHADAAFVILSQDPKAYSGQLTIDTVVLESQGITDITPYKVDKTKRDSELNGVTMIPENYKFKLPPKKVLSTPSQNLLERSNSRL
ncbi:short chain dehydrogenase family protein [Hyaloraphidium curvatum]|nr:short chain dehydrogenase family protein [Hyaloraphidium curvatum]